MIPTAQQQSIYDILAGNKKLRQTESGNISVNAVAGSGKTTTAVQAAKYASQRYGTIAFTAFNKAIAEELGKKLGGSAQASTLHSLGMRLVKSKIPSLQVDQFGKKYQKIAKAIYPNYFESRGAKSWLRPEMASLFALINLIRSQAILVDTLTQDLRDQVCKAADIQGITLPAKQYLDEVIGAAFHILEIGSDPQHIVEMDFADMIWLPVRLGIANKDYDLLFADEAQDFNPCQQKLILSVSANTVIVGDPYQSIMGWAGADTNSFKNLTTQLDAKSMPLSVCWRCPSSHLELARMLVPHIEARPDAIAGQINQITAYALAGQSKAGDLIICRNNAPLVGAAYNLMRLKVPCAVKGKSIGDDIVNLVVKLDPLDIKDLHSRLGRWNEREQKKLLDRDAHETAFDALKDKVECITELSQECETIEQMISLCRDLFTESEDVNKVNLSSIHRAKGLEADNVTLLRPDLMCTRAKDEEAFQQEKNLLYVALTRAKSHLVFADGSGASRPELNQWIGDIASRQMPKPRFSHR